MQSSTTTFLWLLVILAVLFISLIPLLNLRLPDRSAKDETRRKKNSRFQGPLRVVQLKYDGGDWNANPDSLPNLLRFLRDNPVAPSETAADGNLKTEFVFGLRGRDLDPNQHHFVYATGHADFSLETADLNGLLSYASGGGVVLIEDNNGLDFYFRLFIEKSLPGYSFQPVKSGPLFQRPFAMPDNRYPKIMKHGNRPAELLRLRGGDKTSTSDIFYSYSSDLGDGWESAGAHGLREEKRLLALRMGANFLHYAIEKYRGR